MEYIGLQQQINSNNRKSVLLLLAFPFLVLFAVFVVIFFMNFDPQGNPDFQTSFYLFIQTIPTVLIAVGIWFIIAYFGNSSMIQLATGSRSLERKDNLRVYNLVENLCMSVGMKTPKINIIETDMLNAFASGINEKSYTVTLTTGIIEQLNDEELEGVIAHELTHIRNKDVRLLIVSIIFVGIFAFVMQIAFRGILYGGIGFGGSSNNKKDKDSGGAAILIIILLASAIAYFFSVLFKLALSRRREYLADAGAVELTHNPAALANALRKISGHSKLDVKSSDVQSMFIDNSPSEDEHTSNLLGGIGNLFSTHPPIEKRIKILEQF